MEVSELFVNLENFTLSCFNLRKWGSRRCRDQRVAANAPVPDQLHAGAVEQYLRCQFGQQTEVIYCKYSQQIHQENPFVNLRG